MSGTSSPFPAGGIRLSGSTVDMKRYPFVFDWCSCEQLMVPYNSLYAVPDPCWSRNDSRLHRRSELGLSFSAFLVLS